MSCMREEETVSTKSILTARQSCVGDGRPYCDGPDLL